MEKNDRFASIMEPCHESRCSEAPLLLTQATNHSAAPCYGAIPPDSVAKFLCSTPDIQFHTGNNGDNLGYGSPLRTDVVQESHSPPQKLLIETSGVRDVTNCNDPFECREDAINGLGHLLLKSKCPNGTSDVQEVANVDNPFECQENPIEGFGQLLWKAKCLIGTSDVQEIANLDDRFGQDNPVEGSGQLLKNLNSVAASERGYFDVDVSLPTYFDHPFEGLETPVEGLGQSLSNLESLAASIHECFDVDVSPRRNSRVSSSNKILSISTRLEGERNSVLGSVGTSSKKRKYSNNGAGRPDVWLFKLKSMAKLEAFWDDVIPFLTKFRAEFWGSEGRFHLEEKNGELSSDLKTNENLVSVPVESPSKKSKSSAECVDTEGVDTIVLSDEEEAEGPRLLGLGQKTLDKGKQPIESHLGSLKAHKSRTLVDGTIALSDRNTENSVNTHYVDPCTCRCHCHAELCQRGIIENSVTSAGRGSGSSGSVPISMAFDLALAILRSTKPFGNIDDVDVSCQTPRYESPSPSSYRDRAWTIK